MAGVLMGRPCPRHEKIGRKRRRNTRGPERHSGSTNSNTGLAKTVANGMRGQLVSGVGADSGFFYRVSTV